MSRFLAAYEDLFAKSTDAPVEFGHAGGLAVLSAIALGRRWIERGASRIKPNIFMLLTADSSRDRKSTSVQIATNILREVESKRIGPDDFTAEGLVSMMRKRPGKGKTRNRLILAIEEFGSYLATARRAYGENLAASMCKMYDGRSFEKARSGKKPILIKDPMVTLFGGVAYGMLEKYADPNDWTTGFFTRILWITPVNRRPLFVTPPQTPTLEIKVAIDKLADLSRDLRTTRKNGAMQLTSNAEVLHAEFSKELELDEAREDPAVVAQRERLLNAVWKLAILYQIDIDPNKPISDQAVDSACMFARLAWQGFRTVHSRASGTYNNRIYRRTWEFLHKKGKPVPKRDIYRTLAVPVEEIMPVLTGLVQAGMISECGITLEDKDSDGKKKSEIVKHYKCEQVPPWLEKNK